MQASVGLSASRQTMFQSEPFEVSIGQLDSHVFDVCDQFHFGGSTFRTRDQQVPLMVIFYQNSGLDFSKFPSLKLKKQQSWTGSL